MNPQRRRIALAGLVGPATTLIAMPAPAQGFPSRQLTILVVYPPGGPADLMARALGEVMQERLGQAVVVDNRPGAGGQIAAAALLRAPADGHTLLVGDTATLGINRSLYANFGHDPLTDMDPVAPVLLMPMVLYVPKASPFQSVAEVVAAARTRPLNYASQGAGSLGHLLGEMLKADAGGQFTHVPYKGSAPAMADLLGGQVDLLFDGLAPGLPHLRADKIRALAAAGPQRLPQLPQVPTTAEAGLPRVVLSLWLGMVARAGTPAAAVQRLHAEVTHAMSAAKFAKRFGDLGFQFLSMSPDEFRAFIRREADRSAELVRTRRISVD